MVQSRPIRQEYIGLVCLVSAGNGMRKRRILPTCIRSVPLGADLLLLWRYIMRLVTINPILVNLFSEDTEMLSNNRRPCALIIRLKYKQRNYQFAVPLRSNINGSAPKNLYFPLPTRSTTRSGNRHGLHYIKMFPVKDDYIYRFRIEGNEFATMIKSILDRNENQIIKECQQYLWEYENGNKPLYSTDIDKLISLLETLTNPGD